MAAQIIGGTATAETPSPDSQPLRRPLVIERARFPLVLKLFVLTALLIIIVVGIAVGITVERANAIAHATVNTSISNAAKLFRDFERQRLERLTLSAQIVGNNISFVAYIQKGLNATSGNGSPTAAASPPIDLVSILDQLSQWKESLGSDLLILLDDQGRVVARTDDPAVTTEHSEDLYSQSSLVQRIVDDASIDHTLGVLVSRGRMYHATVVPVATGANRVRVAYLVNAYAIDDTFANRIAESTNAGVMFAAAPSVLATGIVARSSNSPSVGVQQMSGIDQVFRTGKPIPPSDIQADRSAYVLTGEPLFAGHQTLGAAVFVRSLDRELAPFREIEHTLFAGGGAALVLALIFSWFIAKRVTRPIENLATVAQEVTSGNYSVEPSVDGTDEIGILGRSFAQMIRALRDKAALEELYHQMAARSGERDAGRLTRGTMSTRPGGDAATMWLGTTTPPPSMAPAAPGELGEGEIFANRYRIEQVVGRGGMGVVYKAFDTQLEEIVAIKTLPGDVMHRSGDDLERFKREIRVARRITHRNVVRTYDYGEAEGVYFISMEFVRGYTLADCLADAPDHRMPPRVALGTARQICRGLQAAHEQGIVHRDIKPQNVLIDHKGEVKLMDFGIARITESADAMTAAGLIIGTPHYMSPEQVQGNQLDARADVYSMGVLLYEMLSGHRPFESSSLTGVLTAHLTQEPPSLDIRADVNREVNTIVLRCMQKDRDARYADAGELLAELDRVQTAVGA